MEDYNTHQSPPQFPIFPSQILPSSPKPSNGPPIPTLHLPPSRSFPPTPPTLLPFACSAPKPGCSSTTSVHFVSTATLSLPPAVRPAAITWISPGCCWWRGDEVHAAGCGGARFFAPLREKGEGRKG
ncbi:unnamed protein product [Linum trigynum]|uniref:Uncharacterized protein n=1 Tax=Linum trigynum TaxID=586398 RepID=A0AAV2FTX4_9ROSI